MSLVHRTHLWLQDTLTSQNFRKAGCIEQYEMLHIYVEAGGWLGWRVVVSGSRRGQGSSTVGVGILRKRPGRA